MGMFKLSDDPSGPPNPLNPDPAKFELVEVRELNGWSIAVVRYPNCINYRGRKILVYNNPPEVVRAQVLLDPHFLEHGDLSPVARFVPTDLGLKLAVRCIPDSDEQEEDNDVCAKSIS